MIEFLSRGLYSPRDAARLLAVGADRVRVDPARVRRWSFGYRRRGMDYPGAIDPVVPEFRKSRAITFLELIELLSVRAFLQAGASWPMIRTTLRHAAEILPGPFPFAREHWFADPHGIYYREKGDPEGTLFEISSGGQVAIEEALLPYLRRIQFGADGLAEAWYPLGKDQPVMVDPRREFGAPTVAGTSVRTDVLAALHAEGKSVEEVAWWYGLRPEEVDAALAFERTSEHGG